jgi:hypothetical protein
MFDEFRTVTGISTGGAAFTAPFGSANCLRQVKTWLALMLNSRARRDTDAPSTRDLAKTVQTFPGRRLRCGLPRLESHPETAFLSATLAQAALASIIDVSLSHFSKTFLKARAIGASSKWYIDGANSLK